MMNAAWRGEGEADSVQNEFTMRIQPGPKGNARFVQGKQPFVSGIVRGPEERRTSRFAKNATHQGNCRTDNRMISVVCEFSTGVRRLAKHVEKHEERQDVNSKKPYDQNPKGLHRSCRESEDAASKAFHLCGLRGRCVRDQGDKGDGDEGDRGDERGRKSAEC